MQREVTDKLEQQMKAVNRKQKEMEKKLQESQVYLKQYTRLAGVAIEGIYMF